MLLAAAAWRRQRQSDSWAGLNLSRRQLDHGGSLWKSMGNAVFSTDTHSASLRLEINKDQSETFLNIQDQSFD